MVLYHHSDTEDRLTFYDVYMAFSSYLNLYFPPKKE
jgi:hypothetical protein